MNYYKALLVEGRDERGVTAYRKTSTYYRDESTAQARYGDQFYMLCTSEDNTLKMIKPFEIESLPCTSDLQPMDTAPKDGTWILLFGKSGNSNQEHRCEICKWDKEFRPMQPWINHSNDSFTDSGGRPVAWMPLPPFMDFVKIENG